MRRNTISPNLQKESFNPTGKYTELLIVYFSWLKISGLHEFKNPKTENIAKTCHRILFKIQLIFNVLSHISIAAFCLVTTFTFPIQQEEAGFSLGTFILCLTFALSRAITYFYLKEYFPALADHLLRSQPEHCKPGDQSKCFHFNLPVFILAFPIAVIVVLCGSGIVNALLSHWQSVHYPFLKLSLHLLILQAIAQQVAILFLFIGTCFHSLDILKNICESVKELPGMNCENLGHSIRSLCNEYSDFIVLMEELNNNLNPIAGVLTATLGMCVLLSAQYRNYIDPFEICELGIFTILGICALLAIIVAIDRMVNNKIECKLHLFNIKLDRVSDEFKIDLSIFQERIFHSSIPLQGKLTTLPPLIVAFLMYQLNAHWIT